MTKLKKHIHKITLIVYFIWLLFPIIMSFINLEFNDNKFEDIYYKTRLFGAPFFIMFSLFWTMGVNDAGKVIGKRILKKVVYSGLLFLFLGFLMVFDMCGWSNIQTLYTNKNNPKITIIQRSYNCGAYDSDSPDPKYYKIKEFTPYFIFAKKVDLETLDKSKWL